jgi:hypothetical protein
MGDQDIDVRGALIEFFFQFVRMFGKGIGAVGEVAGQRRRRQKQF